MGSTILTNKRAAAFQDGNGQTIFVLFEETYEKNVHPHKAEWGCIFIGSIEETLRSLFKRAYSCVSGMLRSRSGEILPENYLRAWLSELKKPVFIGDQIIDLVVGDRYSSSVPSSQLDWCRSTLAGEGRQDLADKLGKEDIRLNLHAHGSLLAKLYTGDPLGPWRIIRVVPDGPRSTQLGYAPQAVQASPPQTPVFLKVDAHSLLMQGPDDGWFCAGWEYHILGSYVSQLWTNELREPGSYLRLIKNYREALRAAGVIPPGTKIEVDETVPLEESYEQRNVADAKRDNPVTLTERGFSFAAPTDEQLLYRATNLPQACTRWLCPGYEAPATQAAAAEGQLDIFAAA